MVLQVNADQYATCLAKHGGTVKLGKMACDTAELLGVAFGSRLQVVSCGAGKGGRKAQGRLVPLDERVLATDAEELETRAPPAPAPAPSPARRLARALTRRFVGPATGTNNSELVDNNTAQMLKHEEIEQMKQDGVGGKEIVDAVVKNSATYEKKTEYAKENATRGKSQ